MSGFANSGKVNINGSDITIGAVEIKDAYGSARAIVDIPIHMSESNELLGVQAPVLGIIDDVAVVDNSPGTLSAKLRGLVTLLLALNNLLDGPVLGTSVYLTVSGVSAELGADITAGEYLIFCTCDVTFAITAAGGGGSVVWATSPGIILSAGVFLPFRLTASQRIAAITTGGATGSLMILPVG